MTNKFYESIKYSTQESQVQEAYNNAFKSYFNISLIERKHQCDGYFEAKTNDNKDISVLIEYKYDIRMKDRVQRSKVIAQCLGYLKQFEYSGEKLPKLVFIGDINECCVIHTNDLFKLLDLENVDWSVAPSSMGDKNIDLVFNIAKDISPWVYDVNDDFKFQDVADKIVDLCSNVSRKLHITEKNIEKVYNLFCDRVIKDKKKVQANDLVSTFIGVMLDSEHYYQHPKKKNILIANNKTVQINGDQFTLFMGMHSIEYTPKEKRIMTAISDRLIEDTNRRNKGEFYTPTLFVDYAHKMIEKELGQHWKENYVVWDPACGTKNLTRDYKFKELYCSTLEQAELDISKNYNKEACSFQFDFLNDSLDDLKVKAPRLLEAFELNKPIVFFLNPPYGTSNGVNSNKINKTNISIEMNKYCKGSAIELANQFIYRIIKIKERYSLTNVKLAVINKTSYLQSSKYKSIRELLFNNFEYCNGVQFNGSIFNTVANGLGLSFIIYKSTQISYNYFNGLRTSILDNELNIVSTNIIYNFDDGTESINQYSTDNDLVLDENTVKLANPILFSNKNTKTSLKVLGEHFVHGVDLYSAVQLNALYSHPSKYGGIKITKNNFEKCMEHFSVKFLVKPEFYNDRTPLSAPTKHDSNFTNCSIIISLFSKDSGQTSLRNDKYLIKNEFFWMSKQEMLDLAEEYNNDYTYEDALNSDERFVYNYIQDYKSEFSAEALAVLDKATQLVKDSFKYRQLFDESHPEYQINNWDCGWYQLKALLKEFMSNELKEFRTLYKQLADKMRPMIYELGFLRK